MKRLYMVVITLFWVGCSDDLTSDQLIVERSAIVFGESSIGSPEVSLSTRSDIVYDQEDIASFGVYAYSTTTAYMGNDKEYDYILKDEDNIMSNRRVQRSDITDPTSSWTYTPIEYWDTDVDYLDGDDDDDPAIYFLAYSPYSSGLIDTSIDGSDTSDLGSNYDVNINNGINSYRSNDHIYISYTMPTEVRNQPDILVANPVVMSYDSSYSATEADATYDTAPVSFEFNHALATVGFKLNGNSSYRVLAIALVGIYNYADLILGEGENEWDNKSSNYSYDSDVFNDSGLYYHNQDYSCIYFAGLTDEASMLVPSADSNDEPKIITADDGYIMVIPQTVTNNARVHVQYTYASADVPEDYDASRAYHDAYYKYSGSYSQTNYDFDVFTLDYYLGGSRGWYANNNYYYVITLP